MDHEAVDRSFRHQHGPKQRVGPPVIESERLYLRGHRLDDFDRSAALWADPIVTRYIGGRPFSREESWTRFLRYAGHWTMLGFGYWVLEEKCSGAYLGEAGFADYCREIDPPLSGIPEAGWVLHPSAHGRGIAREAVRAMHQWADEHFAPRYTVCLIHPENVRSRRIAEICGYTARAQASYKGQPTILFERRP